MIKSIGKGIWVAEGAVNGPAGLKLSVRSTILSLDGDSLMVISPIKPTPELIKSIQDLGYVKYIVAPNCMHHIFVNKFASYFPLAEIWGPIDLHSKRPDISFTGVLHEDEPMPWEPLLELYSVKARPPLFEEFLFFHVKSETVILTDLMFNFHQFDNWVVALIARLNGGYKRLGMTRVGQHYFNNSESLKGAAKKILEWKPQNLVVAHGDVITGNATPALEMALAEMV